MLVSLTVTGVGVDRPESYFVSHVWRKVFSCLTGEEKLAGMEHLHRPRGCDGEEWLLP